MTLQYTTIRFTKPPPLCLALLPRQLFFEGLGLEKSRHKTKAVMYVLLKVQLVRQQWTQALIVNFLNFWLITLSEVLQAQQHIDSTLSSTELKKHIGIASLSFEVAFIGSKKVCAASAGARRSHSKTQ